MNQAPPTYECPDCEDLGLIIDRDRNAARVCDCVKRKRIQGIMKRSRIGGEFRSKTFDTFDMKGRDQRVIKAYQLAKAYAERFDEVRTDVRHSLGLVGAVGVGKTHLLCAVANVLMSQGIEVRYLNFVTGFKEMFARYDDGGKVVDEIRWDLQTCDVLMIDDLAKGKIDQRSGKADVKRSVFDEVYGLIDYRYMNRLPIIWTSEYYYQLAEDTALSEGTATRLFQVSRIADMTYKKGEAIGSLNYRLQSLGKGR